MMHMQHFGKGRADIHPAFSVSEVEFGLSERSERNVLARVLVAVNQSPLKAPAVNASAFRLPDE
jgi:hypothetical protein